MKVINIFGGPGTGKSVTAAKLFAELIGKSFKRNVYGLSLWDDVIKRVTYKIALDHKDLTTRRLQFYVIRTKSPHWYSVDEIVIID